MARHSLAAFNEFMENTGPVYVKEKDVPKDVKIVKQTMEDVISDPTGLRLHLKPDARTEKDADG